LDSPGVFVELVIVNEQRESGAWSDYDSVSDTGIRREQDLSILESLGLIRHVVLNFEVKKTKSADLAVAIFYYHLTNLGVSFCEVCSRPTFLKLEEIDQMNRKEEPE
jgi:hypothetical protein